MKQNISSKIKSAVSTIVFLGVGIFVFQTISHQINQVKTLKKIVSRLEADSRVAEVLVTGVNFNESTKKKITTIKFLEYAIDGTPLKPKYFDFSGNIIQFQSLVIRFDDIHIRNADLLKGKSAYIFLKVFLLDGKDTQEFNITDFHAVPEGYKIEGVENEFEKKLWEKFWDHALTPNLNSLKGVKNAQIEAPGTMFVPGVLYTIKIEHDGGLRIDASALSPILQGEKLPIQPVAAESKEKSAK
ncbi:MAG: hypothetical protein KBD53_07105 [Candidatus Omnitrophica bacterium]|nr:hypothetical protein [Candidatus Omnitrophota bacterium]